MLQKHSISIRGHQTSYTLEDEFYKELVAIAKAQGIALAKLITEIDIQRSVETNLSSALRLHVLKNIKTDAQ